MPAGHAARAAAGTAKITPVQGDPDIAKPVLVKAAGEERKQLLHAVLDDMYVRNKKIVAIRPKPNYYDLLSMSPVRPNGVGHAGDIRILGPSEKF